MMDIIVHMRHYLARDILLQRRIGHRMALVRSIVDHQAYIVLDLGNSVVQDDIQQFERIPVV